MPNMLMEDIGQQLSHKPFEWKSWWWGIKWETFIGIYPQLTEENPLWQREDSHLENIRLCGLRPNELQEQIAVYWEKSFWRRWLLSFFTDIDSKIVIWSYYKRCLSFRIIHKENPVLEQRLMLYDPEQRLVKRLLHQLKQDHSVLENRLERYSGNAQWVQKNLGSLLAQHEKKRQRFFLKLLNKHLKRLPTECDPASVRKKLEEEYQELEKMLRNYVQNSCNPNVSQQESIPPIIEENPNRDLVYVGPTVISERSVTSIKGVDPICSVSKINNWVSSIRKKIEDLLKEEPPCYEAIQSLLENSLENLKSFIEPQLIGYEEVVNKARYKGGNYKAALEWSELLQNQLIYFFRQSYLLFHPDKSDGDENIRIIKTELFKEFHKFTENSLERLSQGLKTLKRCIPQWKVNLDKRLEEAERDRREFRKWLRAEHAEIRAQHAEIRAEHAEMKTKQTLMEEQLNTLMRQMNPNTFNSEAIPDSTSSHDQSSAQGFFRP